MTCKVLRDMLRKYPIVSDYSVKVFFYIYIQLPDSSYYHISISASVMKKSDNTLERLRVKVIGDLFAFVVIGISYNICLGLNQTTTIGLQQNIIFIIYTRIIIIGTSISYL